MTQPIQFGSPPKSGRPSSSYKPPIVSDITLSPEVVSGFEALAAVLPTRKRKPETIEKVPDRPSPPPDVVANPDPVVQDESSDEIQTPPNFETSPVEDLGVLDAFLFDDMLEETDEGFEDFIFDSHIDFSDPNPLNNYDLGIEEVQRLPNVSSSTQLTSPRPSRSLLLDYYRFPTPSPTCSSSQLLQQQS